MTDINPTIPIITLQSNRLLLFSLSVMSDSLQPHGLQHDKNPCPSLSPGIFSNSCPLISDTIQPSHPLLFPLSLAFSFSQQHAFLFVSNELSINIRWPNYWSISFNISPSSEYSGLISFRIAWFDLLDKSPIKWQKCSYYKISQYMQVYDIYIRYTLHLNVQIESKRLRKDISFK